MNTTSNNRNDANSQKPVKQEKKNVQLAGRTVLVVKTGLKAGPSPAAYICN